MLTSQFRNLTEERKSPLNVEVAVLYFCRSPKLFHTCYEFRPITDKTLRQHDYSSLSCHYDCSSWNFALRWSTKSVLRQVDGVE